MTAPDKNKTETSTPTPDMVMFAIPGVDRRLRDQFIGLCKMKGKTGKEVIEAFLTAFIQAESDNK